MLKDAKETVMKQFNSTSGKTVILPLYSTVELEARMSRYESDEFWLLSPPQECMCTALPKMNKNGSEKT